MDGKERAQPAAVEEGHRRQIHQQRPTRPRWLFRQGLDQAGAAGKIELADDGHHEDAIVASP